MFVGGMPIHLAGARALTQSCLKLLHSPCDWLVLGVQPLPLQWLGQAWSETGWIVVIITRPKLLCSEFFQHADPP